MIARHITNLPPSGIRQYFDLVQNTQNVISLGVGEPHLNTPWHIREAAIYAIEQAHTTYTPNRGTIQLRRAINQHLQNQHNLHYNPDTQILITVGVSQALDLALRATTNPGDEILYHQPSYLSYHPNITMTHGTPKPIPTHPQNNFTPTPEDIQKAITPKTKTLILNYPTNPTGATLNQKQLQTIAHIANQHNLLIITDEIYADLTYDTPHHTIANQPGMKDRTIYLHGLSKTYAMTGFRIAYACAPPPIIEAMLRIHQYTMLCASRISQDAALQALKHATKTATQMKEQYQLRRDYTIRTLNQIGLPCQTPNGAFYAFPSIRPTNQTSQQFALGLLKQQQVACIPGNTFGPAGEGHIRCCYAATFQHLETALERIKHYTDNTNQKNNQTQPQPTQQTQTQPT